MSRTATDKTCRIVIEGSELVEFKRHAHQIPECPGLDRRIQRYDGSNRPPAERVVDYFTYWQDVGGQILCHDSNVES